MARRKRGFLDDGDSDSSQGSDADDLGGRFDEADPDAREERALFEDPYQRKRRRKNGKEDATYGVFADDSEEEGFGGKKRGGKPAKKSDWAKAPSFVSGEKKVDLKQDMEVEEDAEEDNEGMEEDDEMEEADADADADEGQSRPPSPRVREEEEEEPEERPKFGGLGLGASKSQSSTSFSGFTKGGIGSSRPAAISPSPAASHSPSPAPSASVHNNLPTAFGAARPQRSFVRDNTGSANASRSATPLSTTERAHLSKLEGSFGLRMLAKMGWEAGKGLGTAGEGIVAPVESKVRPKNMGIAFRGFGERTSQSKAEARRRGEVVSDDEDEEGVKKAKKAKGKGKEQPNRSDAWKKPKKVKTKVEHKTYEQIVAEAGPDAATPGIGIIIDATGARPREVSSLADVSRASWTPSTDSTRIPEVRHNLRLIVETTTSDLVGLAREAKHVQQRKKKIQDEDQRLTKQIAEEADLISRLQQIHLIVDDITAQAYALGLVDEVSLELFAPYFEKLLSEFPQEFDTYHLDEIVVAAIAPTARRMFAEWNPLETPGDFLPIFKRWRRALKLADHEAKPLATQLDIYGTRTLSASRPKEEEPMTPFESLLWNGWLPRVRSCVNNDWNPREPHLAVELYEAWSTFLPPFIRDNFLDQLILPKVSKAVADWNPRQDSTSLSTLVFPWLPHVGLRLEDLLGDARRKLKSLLRGWAVTDAVPADLSAWREVFDPGDWDAMLLKYVVPKLSATLRDEFRVNPRQQIMLPLERVLLWAPLIRASIFSQLLETEFFPKWLDILHIWLIQPRPNFSEIADWHEFWNRRVFSETVRNMPAVQKGFTRGLDMMNQAIDLGPDAPSKLPRPDYRLTSFEPPPLASAKAPAKMSARVQEITFRSIVEDYASTHNLLFIPSGRVHEQSRMPLFRVSLTADGKGGILVYILDDAVWAPDAEGSFRAISLEDMVTRAARA